MGVTMTRQNAIPKALLPNQTSFGNEQCLALIPLWDLSNHELGDCFLATVIPYFLYI